MSHRAPEQGLSAPIFFDYSYTWTPKVAPTSFPKFPKLPREIQDKIWSIALELHTPRAYNVHLTRTSASDSDDDGPEPQEILTWGLRRIQEPQGIPYYPDSIGVLMKTTRASRAIAKLRWRRMKRVVPFSLGSNTGLQRLKVDASEDLMILQHGQTADVVDDITEVPLPVHIIGYEIPVIAAIDMETVFTDLFCVVPELQMLYLVVSPTTVEWTRRQPWLLPRPAEQALDWYLTNLENAEHLNSSREFLLQDRLYYEVPTSEVVKMGGLKPLFRDLMWGWRMYEHTMQGKPGNESLAQAWKENGSIVKESHDVGTILEDPNAWLTRLPAAIKKDYLLYIPMDAEEGTYDEEEHKHRYLEALMPWAEEWNTNLGAMVI
ncbi:hypothetical protein FALBO_2540 [Fusarium albosuccineum]|uniref:2EXR domain-containing protein n=1 Tax=Fusarium albosuccineum TaxID=1237068 RepID=A0A8H4LLB6_9HYPO|nr:hypothetical protein FALBO_2540 [Fusarium albosuccineum]